MTCEDETTAIMTIIGWILLVLISISGWIMSYWQNRNLQKKQYQIELGTKTVDNGLEYVHGTSKKLNKLSATVSSIMFLEPIFMIKYMSFDSKFEYWQKKKIEIMDDWSNATETFINLIMYLESREVILNKFVKMRHKLLDKYREMETYKPYKFLHDNYFNHMKQTVNVNFREIEKEIKPLNQIIFDLMAYLKDLQVEMQNEFLSEIFDNYRVPRRKPEDPEHEVLTISD